MIIEPKVRGFICTTSHPEGCKENVRKQITYINHSYIFGQVLKSSQMPVKPYFMGVPGFFHIRHSSRIFSHLGVS